MTLGVVHWDKALGRRIEVGPFRGDWTDLGRSAGSRDIGVRRLRLDPEARSTPVHAHSAEEEIFFVLGGGGLSWQDGRTHVVAAGDCLVHLPGREAHTLLAGSDGLDALVFSTRVPVEACRLPRVGVSWLGPSWVTSGEGAHPFAREAALDLPVPEPTDRPSNIMPLADVRAVEIDRGSRRFSIRDLARAAGGHGRLGLRHMTLASGKLSFPLHCHTAEEEFFLVLEGAGVFLLGDDEVDLTPGTAVSRPAGTGVAHALRAADDGPLVYLVTGLRDPKDVAWYPRSQKLVFRGLGNLTGRLDLTDYWDGELDE